MSFAALDPLLLLAPFVLFMLGIAAISWIVMLGGSLQLSLWLTLKDPPTFLSSLLMAILIVVINVVIFFGFHLIVGPQPWYVVACYQAMLQVFLIMAFARCNPIAAFFVAFGHAVFSGIGTIALFIGLFFACGPTLRDAFQRQQELSQQQRPAEVVNPFAN